MYVVRSFGSIVCFTVPVPSHHIPSAGSGTNVRYNLIDSVGVFVPLMVIVGFPVRMEFFLTKSFHSFGELVVSMVR